MKSRKLFIVSALLMLGSLGAFAQEQPTTEEVFNPHWYLQAQIGGQYTLGEIAFSDLLSPNAQLGVGYQFNPVFGTRLAFNFWQGKAGSELSGQKYNWKWSYLAPAIDATFDLTNLIGGYKYDRVCSFGIFAGIGGNFRLGDGNTPDVYNSIPAAYQPYAMEYYKDKSNASFLGRAGLMLDFRLGERVKLGIELAANGVSDKYNYKKAGNIDWYFNALLGLKIALGKNGTHTTKVIPAPVPVERVVEKIVEVQTPCPEAPAAAQAVVEPLRRDIFFTIGSSVIADKQMSKVAEIAEYLQKNPAATVKISGYADAKTGTASINDSLSKKRANAVVAALKDKYNIAENRIFFTSYGSTVQPFADNDSNRVSICIAE